MTQLAILEGETLGKIKVKKLLRKAKNAAKDTGKAAGKVAVKAARAAAAPVKEVSSFAKRQILDKAKSLVNRQVSKFVSKYVSPSKLATTSAASIVASIQPVIQPPIIAALTAIPGAQIALPVAPSLITAATYKAVNDLKQKALKKARLNGADPASKDEKIFIVIGGGLVLYWLLKKRK